MNEPIEISWEDAGKLLTILCATHAGFGEHIHYDYSHLIRELSRKLYGEENMMDLDNYPSYPEYDGD